MAVGLVRPAATSESVKPDGTVAALATCALVNMSKVATTQRTDFMQTSTGINRRLIGRG